jgi:hypothetical protein
MGNPPESENFDPSRHSSLGEGGTPQKAPEIRKSQSQDPRTAVEVLDLGGQPDTAIEPQSEPPELKEDTEKKEPRASEAMVEALSRFIRQEAAKAGEESERHTEFSARQVTVLLSP